MKHTFVIKLIIVLTFTFSAMHSVQARQNSGVRLAKQSKLSFDETNAVSLDASTTVSKWRR